MNRRDFMASSCGVVVFGLPKPIQHSLTFDGTSDTIAVHQALWNRVLSEDEIRKMYKNPFALYDKPLSGTKPVLTNGLVGVWLFNESKGPFPIMNFIK